MNPEQKLASLGLSLPNAPAPVASYVPTVRTGNLLYCAGTICMVDGQMTHTGQVGKTQTLASGAEAARVRWLRGQSGSHQWRERPLRKRVWRSRKTRPRRSGGKRPAQSLDSRNPSRGGT